MKLPAQGPGIGFLTWESLSNGKSKPLSFLGAKVCSNICSRGCLWQGVRTCQDMTQASSHRTDILPLLRINWQAIRQTAGTPKPSLPGCSYLQLSQLGVAVVMGWFLLGPQAQHLILLRREPDHKESGVPLPSTPQNEPWRVNEDLFHFFLISRIY